MFLMVLIYLSSFSKHSWITLTLLVFNWMFIYFSGYLCFDLGLLFVTYLFLISCHRFFVFLFVYISWLFFAELLAILKYLRQWPTVMVIVAAASRTYPNGLQKAVIAVDEMTEEKWGLNIDDNNFEFSPHLVFMGNVNANNCNHSPNRALLALPLISVWKCAVSGGFVSTPSCLYVASLITPNSTGEFRNLWNAMLNCEENNNNKKTQTFYTSC